MHDLSHRFRFADWLDVHLRRGMLAVTSASGASHSRLLLLPLPGQVKTYLRLAHLEFAVLDALWWWRLTVYCHAWATVAATLVLGLAARVMTLRGGPAGSKWIMVRACLRRRALLGTGHRCRSFTSRVCLTHIPTHPMRSPTSTPFTWSGWPRRSCCCWVGWARSPSCSPWPSRSSTSSSAVIVGSTSPSSSSSIAWASSAPLR